MKNTVPLVLALVFGVAAVVGVSRLISSNAAEEEKKYVYVVAAARDIVFRDGEIKDSWLLRKRVEISSLPAKAIRWDMANSVVGQTVVRTVAKNDYILSSDISGVDIRLSGLLAEGEWAVPVTFADPALVRFLQPGDEIAVMGAYEMKEEKKKIDMSEKAEVKEKQAMSVIFPCVRILDIGKGDGVRRGEEGAGTVIVSLNPQQAMTLVAAQREMELYPALRRANDASVRRRRDVGLVGDGTFEHMKTGLNLVTISDAGASEK